MTLQESFKEFAPYDIDFRTKDGKLLIGVTFKESWQVIAPSNGLIEHAQKNGRNYYYAPMSEVDVDEVFTAIKETINYNKDMERKIQLFQKRVEELQNLFSSMEYDELLTLEFNFKKKKGSKKKKTETTKSVQEVVEETTEEDETTDISDFVGLNC